MEGKALVSAPAGVAPTNEFEDINEMFSDSDDEDEENSDVMKKKTISGYIRRKKKAFIKMFVDYGPPYTKMETGIALLDECALPEPSLFEIHSMLNNRITPNFRDPEDYYNSPMHWCARHAHLRPMKLLGRAKVIMNPQNEFGQTPLHVLCIMVFPEDKRKRQLRTFQWMLAQGADINIRDKGGYCAIDYAAMNGHEAMVEILLERGAEVLRDNYTFCADRQQMLTLTVGARSQKLIKDRITYISAEREAEETRVRIAKARAQEQADLKKRHERLARKRDEAIEAKRQQDEREYQEKREADKKAKLEDQARQMKQERNAAAGRFGGWKREESTGYWNYEARNSAYDPNAAGDTLYQSNRKQMKKLRDKNKFEVYNSRWQQKTGNDLEVKWTKQEVFNIADIDSDDENKADGKKKKKPKDVIDSLSIRDENDAELEGEDIGDLLAYV